MQILLAVLILCDPGSGSPGARPPAAVESPPLEPAGAAAETSKPRVREDRVYYGDPRRFSNPAEIDAIRVYQEIPAYQQLLDQGITKDDPEYWPLLRKASGEFIRALKAVCARKDIDLVAQVGSIESREGTVPEITAAVIESVRKEKPRDPEPRRQVASGPRLHAPRIHAPRMPVPRTIPSLTLPGRIETSAIRPPETRPSNVRHPRPVQPPQSNPPRVRPGRIIPPRTTTSRIVPPRVIPSRIVPSR